MAKRPKRVTGEALKTISHNAALIFTALSAGNSIADLIDSGHSPKSVNKAISDVSSLDPKKFAEVFGYAASADRFLLDAGVDSKLVLALHRNFGQVSTVKCGIGTNTNDGQVFDYATKNGFSAIVTWDGHRGLDQDLCTIAEQAYAKSSKQILYPAVIVLPAHTQQSLAMLETDIDAIQAYLERHKADPANAGIWHYEDYERLQRAPA